MLRLISNSVRKSISIPPNSVPGAYLLRTFASNRWDSADEAEFEVAREWVASLSSKTIPKNIGSVSYSTSSGPGGQNVNRSNTKATLTIPLASLLPLVPKALHEHVRSSHYFAKGSDSLVIQSQESRIRSSNISRCHEKLLEVLSRAGEAIPGKTSPEQRERVKRLQAAETEGRMRMKKAQSQKKQGRRTKGADD